VADKKPVEKAFISIGNKLSGVFDKLQDAIRERAYHISMDRDPDQGDAMADWLDAQLELVTPIELEVKEQKKNIVVEGNLKGFSPEEIEIEVESDFLKVFGSHTESDTNKKGDATKSASESVYFYQLVRLPTAVDLDDSHAQLFKNGKLKVTLPKKVAKT